MDINIFISPSSNNHCYLLVNWCDIHTIGVDVMYNFKHNKKHMKIERIHNIPQIKQYYTLRMGMITTGTWTLD